MPYPKITIITPSFNQGQFLEQTIDSVLSQNYPNLEYMVIDGASTDNSVEIIKKYEKHLSFWVSEPDKGQSDAINKGLQKATGDIVNWLNSDDYYEKNTLEVVSKHFEDENINVVCGKSRIFYDENNQTSHFSKGTDIYPNNLSKTIGCARIDQPETFFRASAIKEMGLINPKFHYVMDKEWFMRYLFLFGTTQITQIDDILVNFRLHGNSKTVSQQAGFQTETNSIFYQLATIIENNAQKEVLAELSEIKNYIDTEFYQKLDKKTITEAINYYFLYKTDEYYYNNDRLKAKKCFETIDFDILQTKEQDLYKTLKIKMRIPAWITNMIRYFINKKP